MAESQAAAILSANQELASDVDEAVQDISDEIVDALDDLGGVVSDAASELENSMRLWRISSDDVINQINLSPDAVLLKPDPLQVTFDAPEFSPPTMLPVGGIPDNPDWFDNGSLLPSEGYDDAAAPETAKTQTIDPTKRNMPDQPALPGFVFDPAWVLSPEDLFQYRYDSDFFKFLDPLLREYIVGETVGVDAATQDAIFNADHARTLQDLQETLLIVDRLVAHKGFPLPNSMLMKARGLEARKYQDARSVTNFDAAKAIADRAQSNAQHAIDAGLKMEDINSRFLMEFYQLYLYVAEVLIRGFAIEAQAKIDSFQTWFAGVIDLSGVDIDTQSADAKLQSSIANELFSRYKLKRFEERQKVKFNRKLDELNAEIELANTTQNLRIEKIQMAEWARRFDEWQTQTNMALRMAEAEFDADVDTELKQLKFQEQLLARQKLYIEQERQFVRTSIEQAKVSVKVQLEQVNRWINYYKAQVVGKLGELNAVNVAQ